MSRLQELFGTGAATKQKTTETNPTITIDIETYLKYKSHQQCQSIHRLWSSHKQYALPSNIQNLYICAKWIRKCSKPKDKIINRMAPSLKLIHITYKQGVPAHSFPRSNSCPKYHQTCMQIGWPVTDMGGALRCHQQELTSYPSSCCIAPHLFRSSTSSTNNSW